MLNRIILMGRLTRDPELRHTQTGTAVASFSLAVDRDFRNRDSGEKGVDFIDVVAWRQYRGVRLPLLHQGPHGCGGGPPSDP